MKVPGREGYVLSPRKKDCPTCSFIGVYRGVPVFNSQHCPTHTADNIVLSPKINRIVSKTGSSITFKPYPAGKECFQGPKVDYIFFEDGPELYHWWEMPLYWWRVLVNKMRRA